MSVLRCPRCQAALLAGVKHDCPAKTEHVFHSPLLDRVTDARDRAQRRVERLTRALLLLKTHPEIAELLWLLEDEDD